MIFLKKLWLALSLSAFVVLAVVPAVAAAQYQNNSSTGFQNNSSGGFQNNSSSGSGFQNNSSSGSGFQNNSSNSVGGLKNPLGNVTGICQLLKILLNVAILTGVPIAMLFIAYAGLRLVMARGNPEALRRARLNLMWTFIGIALFLGVWFFVQILANTLGALGIQILGDCR